MTEKSLREKLREGLDEAEWEWLSPHAARGVMVMVAHGLEILDAAESIALDEQSVVSEWLKKKKLYKPDLAQLEKYAENPRRRFLCVVVEPFVLAQEILLN